jgi:hypothetical protein
LLDNIVESIKTQYKQAGWHGVMIHLIRHAMVFRFSGSGSRLFLIALSEPKPTDDAAQKAAKHSFKWAEREDLSRMLSDPEAKINQRDLVSFDRGNRCLLQHDGDKLVGYTWVSLDPLIEILWGVHFNMPDDMVYNYNGFTTPAYRGTAYQALRHLKLLDLMRSEGKKRLFGYVDHMNYKSLRGTQKSGYKTVGTISGFECNKKFTFKINIDHNAWAKLVRSGPHQFS